MIFYTKRPEFGVSLRIVTVLTALTACSTPATAAEPTRIVAIGDLHGDLPQTLAVLRLAALVDGDGHWSGGEATLVQTGDQTDRGPDSKAILELLTRLETEASAAGGRVIALIGNHEVMNIHGDWRYVTQGDLDAYGGTQARIAAFSPTGASGRFVREHGAVAKVEDTVFVHGGIAPTWAALGVDGLNAAVREGLDQPGSPVLGETGPLWLRGYAAGDEPMVCPIVEQVLDTLGARRMVMGHTVQMTGITTRCDGHVVLIDVGMASHYGGTIAAWEWLDGDTRALLPTGPHDLRDPPP